MDYAQYVSRRPPSPPCIPFKNRHFSPNSSITAPSAFDNTSLMSIPLTSNRSKSFTPNTNQQKRPTQAELHAADVVTDAIVHNRQPKQYISNQNVSIHTQPLSSPPQQQNDSSNNFDHPIFDTTLVSTFLHRRAVCGEYRALAELLISSSNTIMARDRLEIVRIRLEDMLTHADGESSRVLNLALSKCDSRLNSLYDTQRLVDDASSRMRVIESKHFQGARAVTNVPYDLRRLHLKREGILTLVEHIRCTLFDQVRIHYMLTVLSGRLTDLKDLLSSLDRDRTDRQPNRSSSSSQTSNSREKTNHSRHLPVNIHADRQDVVKSTVPLNSVLQRHGRSNSYGHGVKPMEPRRHSVNADLVRKSSMQRRISRSNPSVDYSNLSSTSPVTPTSPMISQNQPIRQVNRRTDGRFIPFVVRRALSYNSSASPTTYTDDSNPIRNQNRNVYTSPNSNSDPSEVSWWGGEEPPPTNTTTPVGQSEPKLSLNGFRSGSFRRRAKRVDPGTPKGINAESNTSSGSLSRDSFLPQPFVGFGWRRTNQREEVDSADGDSFPVSPVSESTSPSDHSTDRGDAKRLLDRVIEATGGLGDHSIMHDIDSLCTEASSVLSSSRGMDQPKRKGSSGSRRGSLSVPRFHKSGELQKSRSHGGGLSRLRFGRIRMPSQVKKLWNEINELYGVILIHAPHLLDEKIVPRSSRDTGLLGPWNSRRGHSTSVRVGFHNSAASEATRKVDGIIQWQRRLIIAIRRDNLEQRKMLRQADHIISKEYLKYLKGNTNGNEN